MVKKLAKTDPIGPNASLEVQALQKRSKIWT